MLQAHGAKAKCHYRVLFFPSSFSLIGLFEIPTDDGIFIIVQGLSILD